MPLVMVSPLNGVAAAPDLGRRTKSAHDLGADFGAGVSFGASASEAGCICEVSVFSSSAFGVCSSFVLVGVSCFTVAGGEASLSFGSPGMFGTAMAVRVSLRACCCCVGVGFGEVVGACAGVAGVETCVKSLSDGACEVAGVSGSDGAAMVDVSEGGSSAEAACDSGF